MSNISLDDYDRLNADNQVNRSTPKKTFPLQFLNGLKPDLSDTWRIKGLLPRSGLAVIYGPPGSGKSFIVLKMVLHVASGRTFAGAKIKQGGVVYVSAEAGTGFKRRVIAARDEMSLDDDVPFALITVVPDLGKSSGDAASLIQAIHDQTDQAGWRADIVVIDTTARVIPGADENSSRDMGVFVQNCDMIATQLGVLVCLVHHSGKNTDAGMRGSSALLGAADTVICVNENEIGVRTGRVEKQKDGEDGLSFTFCLNPVTLGNDDEGDPVSTCVISDISELGRSKSKRTPMTKIPQSLKLFMDIFDQAIAELGKMKRPFPDGPEVRTIDREALRIAFYKRTVCETPNSKRSAFNRSLNSAMSAKYILAAESDSGALLWKA